MKSEISALMDDALEAGAASGVLDALSREAALRDTWQEYCLIGDTLRRSYPLSQDFSARVMAQLESEPTVLAPRRARRGALLRFALPLAASVMGVAVVAWLSLSSGPDAAPPGLAAGTPAVVAANAANPAPMEAESATPVSTSTEHVVPYLVVHQGYSSGGGLRGVAQYVRAVSESR